MPYGVPFSADAANLHGGLDRRPPSDNRHNAPDPGYSRELPMGRIPAQPRRGDARDGDRSRARLFVEPLWGGSARADQSGNPPPARAANGKRSSQDRAA